MRPLRCGVLVLVLLAGCKRPESLVVVQVSAKPALTNVTKLQVTVDVGTDHHAQFDDNLGGGMVSLPPDRSFGIIIPPGYGDQVTVTVSALAGSLVLATGSASGSLTVGGTANLAIQLGAGAPVDLAGADLTDGGAPPQDLTAPDLVARDLTARDLADAATSDGAPGDANTNNDFVLGDLRQPDLVQPDLLTADLVSGPDLLIANFPAHLPSHYLTDGTCDLSLATGAIIDTTMMTITNSSVTTGCVWAVETPMGGVPLAVLAVHSLTVASGTVTVVGTRGLAIVAGGNITIIGTVNANALLKVPGPGGSLNAMGLGAGVNGADGTNSDTGGGGAGHATNGAKAGNCTLIACTGPPGGPSYNDAAISKVLGGSGGGDPGSPNNCTPIGRGGAGGGYLQLTAAGALLLSGKINAGGGGGGGGCVGGNGVGGGGGGGGSGGAIFLESPSLSLVSGAVLAANGGGGGGGASSLPTSPGSPGNNGLLGAAVATGGMGGDNNGAGGNGGFASNPPTVGGNNLANTGGGGGAVGRIVLRSRVAVTAVGVTVSPAASPILDL